MRLHPDASRAIEVAGDLPTNLAPAKLRGVHHAQPIALQPDPLPIASPMQRKDLRGRPPARFGVPSMAMVSVICMAVSRVATSCKGPSVP